METWTGSQELNTSKEAYILINLLKDSNQQTTIPVISSFIAFIITGDAWKSRSPLRNFTPSAVQGYRGLIKEKNLWSMEISKCFWRLLEIEKNNQRQNVGQATDF